MRGVVSRPIECLDPALKNFARIAVGFCAGLPVLHMRIFGPSQLLSSDQIKADSLVKETNLL